MSPKLHIIDNHYKFNQLVTYLADKEYISFDTETTGLHKGAEIIGASFCASEEEAFYVILGKYNIQKQNIEYTNLYDDLKNLLLSLLDKKLIMHNAIFDCIQVKENFKINLIQSLHTDTMVLAHLLNENRKIGLKELSKEYFGEDADSEAKEMKASVLANGGKLTRTAYEMWKCDPYIMAKYGAKDALLTYKLFLTLVPELYAQGLDKFFYEDESMPLLKGPTFDLNDTGLRVDVEALETLKKTLEVECVEDMAFIQNEIAQHIKEKYPGTNKNNKFNITSSQQLSWLLFGQLNLEFNTLTKRGREVAKDVMMHIPYNYKAKKEFIHECQASANQKYNNPFKFIQVDKKTLEKHSNKLKWVKKLLEYNKKMKLLTTYVKGIEERIQYGIIYPSFLQTGTTSGRYSSRNPNFQNLPRDDKRVKSCIIPRPGHAFVGADYSQLEPRVFAYFSNDPRLLQAFNGKTDFYSVIGIEVFGKTDCTPQKEGPGSFGEKYKELRNLSKTIALAATYGASARQLSSSTRKSIQETQLDIDSYFESFPGVKNMMLKAHETVKKEGQVKNLFGRPRRMPDAMFIKKRHGNANHQDLPYDARNLLNLAVNHKIQSTAASIVNRSAIKFIEYIKLLGMREVKIVLQVHDSLVIECLEKDVNDVRMLLQEAMESTVELKGLRLEAIPKVGKNLSEV